MTPRKEFDYIYAQHRDYNAAIFSHGTVRKNRLQYCNVWR